MVGHLAGAHFVGVDEQHDAVREHRRELREAGIALGRCELLRHPAARERLEPEQQPHRIVRDLEHEPAVGRQRQHDARPLRFVGEWGSREREDQQRERHSA
jgi:hypothetical protein